MDKISDILITLGRLARDHNSIDKIILDNDSSKKLADYIYQKHQEIQRLNDIINELEKVLKQCMQHYDYLYDELEEKEALDIYYIYKYVFDKLQELKGSDK